MNIHLTWYPSHSLESVACELTSLLWNVDVPGADGTLDAFRCEIGALALIRFGGPLKYGECGSSLSSVAESLQAFNGGALSTEGSHVLPSNTTERSGLRRCDVRMQLD